MRIALAALILALLTHAARADSYLLTLTGPSTNIAFTEPSSWSFVGGMALIVANTPYGSGTYNGTPGYLFSAGFDVIPSGGVPALTINGSAGPGTPSVYLQLSGPPMVTWDDEVPNLTGLFLDTFSLVPGTYNVQTYAPLTPDPIHYVFTIGPLDTASTPEPSSLLLLGTALAGGVLARLRAFAETPPNPPIS